MGTSPIGTASELDALRLQYESSLSWRLTRPLRSLSRAVRRPAEPVPDTGFQPAPLSAGSYDLWLQSFWDEQLSVIDSACAAAAPERYTLFRDLEADLWALLLAQDYEAYPNIRALLPDIPSVELQVMWNGTSGLTLAAQSCAFYRLLGRLQAEHGQRPLEGCRVLDFGCGWGRLTRFLARDIEPGCLCGCDPAGPILDVARNNGVPAELALSEFVPQQLPFDQRFDLAFAFSVFTHLSESAHLASLRALHAAIVPGGLLVATVRPPEYLRVWTSLHPALTALGPAPARRLDEPLYLFAPHDQLPLMFDGEERELTYGDTVITLAYVREHWSEMFELIDIDLVLDDPHQIVLTLRRR